MESFIEFGLRDWLLILGSVFLIGVLLHGYWRMRSNRGSLKMSLDKSFLNSRHEPRIDADDLAPYRAELPNGGARLISDPKQAALDLAEAVPVLMEPIDVLAQQDPLLDILPDDLAESTILFETSLRATRLSENLEPESLDFEPPVIAPLAAEANEKSAAGTNGVESDERSPAANPRRVIECPEKFLVLYVSARLKDFSGPALLACLQQQNMTFGEMHIYHRLGTNGQSLFSLVNAVEPGAFDPAAMDTFKTPAVSLFMRAHELTDPVGVYHEMLGLAEYLKIQLDGEIRDEARKPLTRHSMELYQEDLQSFVDTYFH